MINIKTALAAMIAVAVSGCQWYEGDPESPDNSPKFTVLRATTDEEDLGDLTLFCIDGITYVAIPGIGMSVKYIRRMGSVNDYVVETCVNHIPINKKRTTQ